MVMIYTSTECEKDCFEDQIVKTYKRNILGVGDQWDKTIIILDHIGDKKTLINQYYLLYACALSNKRVVKWLYWYPNC